MNHRKEAAGRRLDRLCSLDGLYWMTEKNTGDLSLFELWKSRLYTFFFISHISNSQMNLLLWTLHTAAIYFLDSYPIIMTCVTFKLTLTLSQPHKHWPHTHSHTHTTPHTPLLSRSLVLPVRNVGLGFVEQAATGPAPEREFEENTDITAAASDKKRLWSGQRNRLWFRDRRCAREKALLL